MIEIANHLITRRCNLSCDYCGICISNLSMLSPSEYPNRDYYLKNELDYKYWIKIIDRLYNHNPNMFHIIYGGEPILKRDLPEIINHLNSLNAAYTIISNCTEELKDLRENLFKAVNYKLCGWTASVDPGFYKKYHLINKDDEIKKSSQGFLVLKEVLERGISSDVVAEITCDKNSIFEVEETIALLSENGIYSDLTVLDISRNNYWDFSAITNPDVLVPKTIEVKEIINRLINSDYKIHAKETLLSMIYNILPANFHCQQGPNNIHNITIDADGKLRTCLRIRGKYTPEFDLLNYLDEKGNYTNQKNEIETAILGDYQSLCETTPGCSWTCMLMSNYIDNNTIINH